MHTIYLWDELTPEISEYLARTDFITLNLGNEPTFCIDNRKEVTDITLAILNRCRDGDCPKISMSNHRYILNYMDFLEQAVPVECSNPRATRWKKYQKELKNGIRLHTAKCPTEDDIEVVVSKLRI